MSGSIKNHLRRSAKALYQFGRQRCPKLTNCVLRQVNKVRAKSKALPSDLKELVSLPDTITQAELLATLINKGVVDEKATHMWLSTLFEARRLEAFGQALANDTIPYKELKLYHQIRLAHYKGATFFSDGEMQTYCQCMQQHFLADAVVNLALEQAIRHGNASMIRQILDSIKAAEIRHLPKTYVSGALRMLHKANETQYAHRLLSTFLEKARPEDILYFHEMACELFGKNNFLPGKPSASAGWRSTLDLFASSYTAEDNNDYQQFQHLVVQPLRSIPADKHDLMDIRFIAQQREHLRVLIQDKIIKRQAFSLIRLGDGEAYAYTAPAMEGVDSLQFDDDNQVRELHWWGKNVPASIASSIRKQVRAAVDSADVLGIPSVYRFIRDRGPEFSRFGSSRIHRGLAAVMHGIKADFPASKRFYTEERCHQILFDAATLERLSALASKTVVIGCWETSQLNIQLSVNTTFVNISPQAKVRDAYQGSESRPLFETYEQINEQIRAHARPGALVLVAAGLIGKIFVHTAQEQGAVALDIGSMLDYFAGYKTRGIVDVI